MESLPNDDEPVLTDVVAIPPGLIPGLGVHTRSSGPRCATCCSTSRGGDAPRNAARDGRRWLRNRRSTSRSPRSPKAIGSTSPVLEAAAEHRVEQVPGAARADVDEPRLDARRRGEHGADRVVVPTVAVDVTEECGAEDTVIGEKMPPGSWDEGGEAREEGVFAPHHVGRSVVEGMRESKANVSVLVDGDLGCGERGTEDVADESLTTGAVVRGNHRVGVEGEAVEMGESS